MIYTTTTIVLFVLSFIVWRSPHKEKTILVYVALWLIIHDGFRWQIGIDWDPYMDFFLTGENSHMGITYLWFNKIVKYICNSYTAIVLLIAIMTYTVVGYLFHKYSPNAVMSMLIYYCTMMGTLGSNRQILSIIVCVISLKYVIDRKPFFFWIAIIIASSFHIIALVFIPAYYLYGKKISTRTILLVSLIAFVIGFSKVINKIPFVEYLAVLDNMSSGTTMLTSYVDRFDGVASVMGSLKRLLFVILALRVRERVNNPNYDFFLVLFAIGGVIFMIFNGSVLQIVAGKASGCYSIYECIVVPFIIYYIPLDKKLKKLIWLCYFLLIFMLMWRDMNGLKDMVGYDIYNPYKSVLFY